MSILPNDRELAKRLGFDEGILTVLEKGLVKEGVKAAVQYLEEPCTEHPYWRNLHENLYEKHRYLCPDCMAEIHKECGICQ